MSFRFQVYNAAMIMAWKYAGKVPRYLSNILNLRMEILFCSGATALQFLPARPLDYSLRQKSRLFAEFMAEPRLKTEIYTDWRYLSLCDWNKGRGG